MGSQYKNSRDASRVVLMSDTDRVRDSPETMRQWPNVVRCWATVADGGPTLYQH